MSLKCLALGSELKRFRISIESVYLDDFRRSEAGLKLIKLTIVSRTKETVTVDFGAVSEE